MGQGSKALTPYGAVSRLICTSRHPAGAGKQPAVLFWSVLRVTMVCFVYIFISFLFPAGHHIPFFPLKGMGKAFVESYNLILVLSIPLLCCVMG